MEITFSLVLVKLKTNYPVEKKEINVPPLKHTYS